MGPWRRRIDRYPDFAGITGAPLGPLALGRSRRGHQSRAQYHRWGPGYDAASSGIYRCGSSGKHVRTQGGVCFLPSLAGPPLYHFVRALVETLGRPDRVLPGGCLFMIDALFSRDRPGLSSECFAGMLAGVRPDVGGPGGGQERAHRPDDRTCRGGALLLFRRDACGSEGRPLASQMFPDRLGVSMRMSFPRRAPVPGARRLSSDDFMKGGGTARGMVDLLAQVGARPVAIGVVVATTQPAVKMVLDLRVLLTLEQDPEDGRPLRLRTPLWISPPQRATLRPVSTAGRSAGSTPAIRDRGARWRSCGSLAVAIPDGSSRFAEEVRSGVEIILQVPSPPGSFAGGPLEEGGTLNPDDRRVWCADEEGVVAIVLAAGMGKRMRSQRPKVLHAVGGRAMILRVLTAVRGAGVRHAVVVVGHQAEAVREAVEDAAAELSPLRLQFALQGKRLGTGHATMEALRLLPPAGAFGSAPMVLVLYGDTPLLTAEQLRGLLQEHRARRAAATLLTAVLGEPLGYGRILRDQAGLVLAVVEDRDATEAQKTIREVNTGVGVFARRDLEGALSRCEPVNAQGEVYLTEAVSHLVRAGNPVEAVLARDAVAALGVNDRRALAAAEGILRQRTLERLMDAGVTVADPASTFVDETATFGPDCVLLPMTTIEGSCVLGPGCTVGPGAHVIRSRLAAGSRVWHSVVEDSDIGIRASVGPFAHLRRGSVLGTGVEVGNFAEIKNAVLGEGTKQHHHSYIGDAELGPRVNVGAGVITANYDGRHKHRTVVGEGAFLGCNSNLVAPITIGSGAVVGAGTTLAKSPVPADALAVGRIRATIREGWAAARRSTSEKDDRR